MRHLSLEIQDLYEVKALIKTVESMLSLPITIINTTEKEQAGSEKQISKKNHRLTPVYKELCEQAMKTLLSKPEVKTLFLEYKGQETNENEIELIFPFHYSLKPLLLLCIGPINLGSGNKDRQPLLRGCVGGNKPMHSDRDIEDEKHNILEFMKSFSELLVATVDSYRDRKILEFIKHQHLVGTEMLRKVSLKEEKPIECMSRLATGVANFLQADGCIFWESKMCSEYISPLVGVGFSDMEMRKFKPIKLGSGNLFQETTTATVSKMSENTDKYESHLEAVKQMAKLEAFYSTLCVRVKISSDQEGVITIHNKSINSFDKSDELLLRTIAPHVWEALMRVDASRFAVTLADVVSVLNKTHGAESTMDTIAEKISQWMGAGSCSIFTVTSDSKQITLIGTTGISSGKTKYEIGEGLTGEVAKTRECLRISNCDDVSELELIRPGLKRSGAVKEKIESFIENGAIRSAIICPILYDDLLLGVVRVCVAKTGRSVFSSRDESLLKSIAVELGACLKRAKLERDIKSISDETEAVLRDVFQVHQAVIGAVNEGNTTDETPRQVVRLAFDCIQRRHANWKWLNLRVPDKTFTELRFMLNSTEPLAATDSKQFPIKAGDSLGADCYLQGKAIRCPDIKIEKRYKCPYDKLGAQSCYNLPLKMSKKVIGVLSIDSILLNDFNENDEHYLELMGSQLATALTVADSIHRIRSLDKERQAHLEAMAHQLIAPLFAIRSHCENILEGRSSPDRAKKSLTSIAAQSRIAALTASNFGILADILAGRRNATRLQTTKQNLTRRVIEVARDYQPMAWVDEKNIRVQVNGVNADLKDQADSRDAIIISFDERSFPQVLANVIENAVKYSNPFSEVLINIELSMGIPKISIWSTGVLLRKQEAERIFEREYRTSEARKRYPPGTGIGLPIARAIMNAHGWKIIAHPTDHENRTCFELTLA